MGSIYCPLLKAKWDAYDKFSERMHKSNKILSGNSNVLPFNDLTNSAFDGKYSGLESLHYHQALAQVQGGMGLSVIRIHRLKIAHPLPIWSSRCQWAACSVLWLKSYKGAGMSILPLLSWLEWADHQILPFGLSLGTAKFSITLEKSANKICSFYFFG